MSKIAFVDTETTGLLAHVHEIYEVALVIDDNPRHWWLPIKRLDRADPVALSIGGYHDRHPWGNNQPDEGKVTTPITDPADFALDFAELTHGVHLAGAVVSFDEERLRRLLYKHDQVPSWHYHIIDVEALAVGYMRARGQEPQLPWDSDELSKYLGVDPDRFPRHTAMGDALWAQAIYRAVDGTDEL